MLHCIMPVCKLVLDLSIESDMCERLKNIPSERYRWKQCDKNNKDKETSFVNS